MRVPQVILVLRRNTLNVMNAAGRPFLHQVEVNCRLPLVMHTAPEAAMRRIGAGLFVLERGGGVAAGAALSLAVDGVGERDGGGGG